MGKAGDIQENMLAMGRYIREFQESKQGADEIRADNERLSNEIEQLNVQLKSIKDLYDGYRKFATNMVTGGTVKGSVLVDRMLVLEERIKDLRTKNESMELKYSHAYGRKEDYKAMYYEADNEYSKY